MPKLRIVVDGRYRRNVEISESDWLALVAHSRWWGYRLGRSSLYLEDRIRQLVDPATAILLPPPARPEEVDDPLRPRSRQAADFLAHPDRACVDNTMEGVLLQLVAWAKPHAAFRVQRATGLVEEVLGLSARTLTVGAMEDLVHPDDRQRWREAHERLRRRHGEVIALTYRIGDRWVQECAQSLCRGGFVTGLCVLCQAPAPAVKPASSAICETPDDINATEYPVLLVDQRGWLKEVNEALVEAFGGRPTLPADVLGSPAVAALRARLGFDPFAAALAGRVTMVPVHTISPGRWCPGCTTLSLTWQTVLLPRRGGLMIVGQVLDREVELAHGAGVLDRGETWVEDTPPA